MRSNFHIGLGPQVGAAYQQFMAKALVSHGLNLKLFRADGFLPVAKVANEVELLHVDWIHPFYLADAGWKTWLKTLRFKVDLMVRKRIPIVWNVHNLISHEVDSKIEKEALNAFLGNVDRLVTFTQAGTEELIEMYPQISTSSIKVVPHPHFYGCYADHSNRREARVRLGLPEDARVILCLGRLSPYKGIDSLIECFHRVSKGDDYLLIAGEPVGNGYASRLRQLSARSNQIILHLARVADEDLHWYFNAANCSVLPFRRIHNSGSAILSISFGVPVIAPRHSVLKEALPQDAYFEYEAGELCDRIVEVLGKTDLDVVAKRGQTALINGLSWEDAADQFVRVYEELLINGS